MELLGTENACSVILFDLRISESELQTIATALEYVLKNLEEDQMYAVFTKDIYGEVETARDRHDLQQEDMETPRETREFIEGTYREIMDLIKIYCEDRFLPPRFKAWQVTDQNVDD